MLESELFRQADQNGLTVDQFVAKLLDGARGPMAAVQPLEERREKLLGIARMFFQGQDFQNTDMA